MIGDSVMGVTVKFDGATDGIVKEISMLFSLNSKCNSFLLNNHVRMFGKDFPKFVLFPVKSFRYVLLSYLISISMFSSTFNGAHVSFHFDIFVYWEPNMTPVFRTLLKSNYQTFDSIFFRTCFGIP